MKSIAGWIKNCDDFGHPFTLNFDKDGETHKTKVGGFFSLIVKIMLMFYVFTKFYALIYRLENDTYSGSEVVDLDTNEDFKDVDYHQTNLTIIHNLFH